MARLSNTRPSLGDLLPDIPGLTQTVVGFSGGISRLLLEASNSQGLTCILRTYTSQAAGDFIELFCADTLTPVDVHTVSEQEAGQQKDIVLHLPRTRLPDGIVRPVFFRVTHLNTVREETRHSTFKVDTVAPGGDAPIDQPANLPRPRLPALIDAAAAQRGVPVLVDFYPFDTRQPASTYRAVRDRIRLRVGGKTVEHRVTEGEAAGRAPITLVINYGTWLDIGSGHHVCDYDVVDEVGNYSQAYSPAQRFEVRLDPGEKRLPAATVEQAPDGVLNADLLGGHDATVAIAIQGQGYNPGDALELKVQGRTPEGIDVERTYGAVIGSTGVQFVRIPWPNADVLLLVGARDVQLSYVRLRTGLPDLPSENSFVQITGTPVDTGLRAPEVPAATDGVLPAQTHPVVVKILQYSGQRPDDLVSLILEGTYANGHSYYSQHDTRAGEEDIIFSLPNGPDGDIAQLEGGRLRLYYTVNNASQRPPSKDLVIDIGPPQAALPAPDVTQAPAPAFTFNPDISRGNANVTVASHPSFTAGSTVTLYMEGSVPGGSSPPDRFPIDHNWVGRPLPFVIARAFVLANLNGTARLYYTVEKVGQRTLYSRVVVMRVGGSHYLAPPSVLESTRTGPASAHLNPLHVLPPAPPVMTLRVSYSPMLASDDIQPIFKGSYGLGTPSIPPKPGNPNQGFVDFTLGNPVVAANLGRDAQLSYILTRSGAPLPTSEVLTLSVDNLPEQRLDGVSVPQAVNGVIDVTKVHSIQVLEWPFMSAGQAAWLDVRAAADLSVRDGTPVSAQEFAAKRLTGALPAAYLRSLPHLSVLRVEAHVSLNGSPHKAFATALRPVSYRIRNSFGVVATIPVSGTPNDIVISADGRHIYVTSFFHRVGISVIDTQTYRVVHTITGLSHPAVIALNPVLHCLYVADIEAGRGTALTVISTRDYAVIDTVSWPERVTGLAVNSSGSRLYASIEDRLLVIDTATLQTINVIRSFDAGDMVLSPDGNRAFVAATENWETLDLQNGDALPAVNIPFNSNKIAHNPRAPEVYITRSTSSDLAESVVIGDTQNLRIRKTLDGLHSTYQVAFHPRLQRAYVTQTDANLLGIIDTQAHTLIGSYAGFNQPRGLVIVAQEAFAFVANAGNSSVSLVVL